MKKILMAILILLAGLPAGAIDLDSLLIKSVGGVRAYEVLGDMTNYRITGALNFNGMPGRFEVDYMVPDKFYMVFDFGQFSMGQAFDGKTAWKLDHNGQATEMTGVERDEMLKELYSISYAYLFPDRIPGDMAYIGIVTKDGKKYHQVDFYPLSIDTVETFFDVDSGLYRYSSTFSDNIKTISKVDDYREVDNVLMPFHSQTEAPDIPLMIEMQIEEVEFDADIDESMFSMPGSADRDFHFASDETSVTIPFEYIRGHIYIRGTINGKKVVSFILDSGATANIFNQSAVASLDLPNVGSLPAKGMGGFDEVNLVRTDSINIGELTLYRQVAGSMDLDGIGTPSEGEVFGGVLGYDFLSRFPMMIDYDNLIITVYNPDNFTGPEGGKMVPFELFMQIPVIDARLVGIPGKFVVDLGNAFGLVLHESFVKKNNLESKLDHVQKIDDKFGGVGGLLTGKTAFAALFEFGEIRISALKVILAEGGTGISGSEDIAGNIGNLILQNFKVLFDYSRQELTFYETEE